MVGWSTPRATDGSNGGPSQANGALSCDAALAGWSTPRANKWGLPDSHGSNETPVVAAGWATPTGTERSGQGEKNTSLMQQARLSGWATPTVPRAHDSDKTAGNGQCKQMDIYKQLLGPRQSLSPAPTERPAGLALNPRFSLWLMGYPDEWASCGARAMQSCRNSRQSSSSPS